MTNEDVIVTTRSLAVMVGVDPSTVRRWVELGKLTPDVVTPGGHYRFRQRRALAQLKVVAA